MITKDDIIKAIRDFKQEIERRYKVKSIGLFGSFIRGVQKEDSDIDFLVDFEEGADLIDLIELEFFLTEKFNRKVEVVPRRTLKKELKEFILREVAYI